MEALQEFASKDHPQAIFGPSRSNVLATDASDNHGVSYTGALPQGRYYTQLLTAVARVAACRSKSVKAAMLAPPDAEQSLHSAVADIRKLDKSHLEKSGLEGAQQAERLWRKIAADLNVDLSKPSAPAKSERCGNVACPTPGVPPSSVCGGCSKSPSPQSYCGVDCACSWSLQR